MVVPVNAALASSSRSNPLEPVEFADWTAPPPPLHVVTKVLLYVRYHRRAVVESALTVEANGSAAAAATNNESGEAKEARGGRGLVLDGDEPAHRRGDGDPPRDAEGRGPL